MGRELAGEAIRVQSAHPSSAMPITTHQHPSEASLNDGVPFTDVELDGGQSSGQEEEGRSSGSNTPTDQQQDSRVPERVVLPGGYVVDDSKPMGRAVRKMMWAGIRCFDGMEYVGGVVASVLGLTQSRYQWVIDTMNQDDVAAAHEDYLQSRNERVLLFDEIQKHDRPEAPAADEAVMVGKDRADAAPVAAADDLEAN